MMHAYCLAELQRSGCPSRQAALNAGYLDTCRDGQKCDCTWCKKRIGKLKQEWYEKGCKCYCDFQTFMIMLYQRCQIARGYQHPNLCIQALDRNSKELWKNGRRGKSLQHLDASMTVGRQVTARKHVGQWGFIHVVCSSRNHVWRQGRRLGWRQVLCPAFRVWPLQGHCVECHCAWKPTCFLHSALDEPPSSHIAIQF